MIKLSNPTFRLFDAMRIPLVASGGSSSTLPARSAVETKEGVALRGAH
jgi:hypothetical protein